MEIKLMEVLDTDTPIEWWNKNREKLNEVIIAFNEWQIVHKFNEWEKKVLQAKVDLCRRYGEKDYNSFSDWQFEILDEIERFIEFRF